MSEEKKNEELSTDELKDVAGGINGKNLFSTREQVQIKLDVLNVQNMDLILINLLGFI